MRLSLPLYPNDESHPFDVVARPFGFLDTYVFSDMRLTVPSGKYAVNVMVRGVGLDPK
jgi:hypothetical protein